ANVHPPARTPEVWELLTSADNIERSRIILNRVHQRTANSLRRRKEEREAFQQECHARGPAGKQEWFETRPEYENWRRRAANFHQTVQAAISELGKIQRTHNRSMSRDSRNDARESLRKLAIAVQRHQALHAKSGTIAAQEDYELWQLLDRLTVPCGPNQEPTTLRTMLDFYWTDVDATDTESESREATERTMKKAPAGRSGEFTGMPRARHAGGQKNLAG
ncbi:hypothetical protein, partial [Streptomyces scabiei]|uniref:hypothetical protein n=1 Tax=Streptomyces scabiei TaxID=1930 RepID=UPI0005633B30